MILKHSAVIKLDSLSVSNIKALPKLPALLILRYLK